MPLLPKFLSKRQTSTSGSPSDSLAASEPDLPFSPQDSKVGGDVDVEKSSIDKGSADERLEAGHRAEKVELTPMEAAEWNVDGDESPFPEVQACVPTTDDPTLEVNSAYDALFASSWTHRTSCIAFRMWVLTTVFVTLFSGVNQFFAYVL